LTAQPAIRERYPRANQIWRLPLHADGSVTKASVFCHLHGGPSGPDGLALDAEGCLLVAYAGFGTVWRLSPRAEPLDRIASCAGWSTTNLAFGGADRRSLFITESETGSVLRAALETEGMGLYSHAGCRTRRALSARAATLDHRARAPQHGATSAAAAIPRGCSLRE
jgi:hypothetical protein